MVSFLLSNLSEVLDTSWAFQPLFVLVALILGFMYSSYLNLLSLPRVRPLMLAHLLILYLSEFFMNSGEAQTLLTYRCSIWLSHAISHLQLLSFSLAACNSFLSVSLLFSLLLLLLLLSLLFHSQQFCWKSFNFLGYSFHIPAFGFQNSFFSTTGFCAPAVKEKDRQIFSKGRFRERKYQFSLTDVCTPEVLKSFSGLYFFLIACPCAWSGEELCAKEKFVPD